MTNQLNMLKSSLTCSQLVLPVEVESCHVCIVEKVENRNERLFCNEWWIMMNDEYIMQLMINKLCN